MATILVVLLGLTGTNVDGYGFESFIAEEKSYRSASDVGEYSEEKSMLKSLSTMLSREKLKGLNNSCKMSAAIAVGSSKRRIHEIMCEKDTRNMGVCHSHDPRSSFDLIF